ncbi:MAG TPA: hypothetical protein PLQ87_03620, partial [Phycisphaerae bacterium]|nr:hypothetical protein [Phycisphaerae bacterium]
MQNVLPDSIIPLLEKMRELQASDLHLKTGIPPTYRVAGDLRRTNLPPIQVNSRLIERLMDPIIPKARKSVYDETG